MKKDLDLSIIKQNEHSKRNKTLSDQFIEVRSELSKIRIENMNYEHEISILKEELDFVKSKTDNTVYIEPEVENDISCCGSLNVIVNDTSKCGIKIEN